jgi:hypothetical protein
MDTFICLEQCKQYCKIERAPTSKEALVNYIKAGLNALSNIKNKNQIALSDEVYKDSNLWKKHEVLFVYSTYDWKSNIVDYLPLIRCRIDEMLGPQTRLGFTRETYNTARQFTEEILNYLLARQLKALVKVEEENQLHNLVFVDSVNTSRPNEHIAVARTFKATNCNSCGEIIPASSFNSHVGSLKCMLATHERDLREKGWKPVSSSHHLAAIKKAGVNYEVRATGFTMWAPAWVHESIEKFEQGDGYAGMSLAEFLSKMNPE